MWLPFSLFLLSLTIQAQETSGIKFFTGGSGLAINCLFKDNKGIIYAGTSQGILRFDGLQFQPESTPGPKNPSSVTAIFQQKNGKWWIGYEDGSLANIYEGSYKPYTPEEGTPAKKINHFCEDSNGQVWFSAYGEGLYVIHKGRPYLFNEEDGMSDVNIHGLQATPDGSIIALTDQGINVCRFNDKGKKNVYTLGPADGLTDYLVTAIAPAQNGEYYVGTESGGLCIYSYQQKKVHPVINNKDWNFGEIFSITILNNIAWVGTRQGLVSYHITQSYFSFYPQASLKTVRFLVADRQNNFWLSSGDNFITKASPAIANFPILKMPGMAPYNTIHTLYYDGAQYLYTNASRGINRYDIRNQTKTFIALKDLKGISPVTSFFQDTSGVLWIGTLGNGIILLNTHSGEQSQFRGNSMLMNSSILNLSGNDKEVMVSSLQGAGIFHLQDSVKHFPPVFTFTNLTREQTKTNYIYTIFRDSRDRLLFATDGKGLVVKSGGRFTSYDEKSGLLDDHILSIAEDAQQNIWFSTATAGIYKWDGKIFTNYNINSGLSSLQISSLHTNKANQLIIINDRGVDVMNIITGKFYYLNAAQGLEGINVQDLEANAMDKMGNLWLSTLQGIVNVHIPGSDEQQPVTLLDNVQIFLQDLPPGSPHSFPYDENNFTFTYAGLYYSQPSAVLYRYRLEGLDSNWIITNDRTKNFPRLAPGKYTFRVQSSLNKLFINASEASFRFTIQKAFYNTIWFRLLILILAGTAIYLGVKYRVRHFKNVEKLKRDRMISRFEVLRNQVNPHFLFNSFNTLITLIEEKPSAGVAYAEQLSDFFRDIVNYRDKEVISLGEEINVAQNYFGLQEQRYDGALKLEIKVPGDIRNNFYLPPLCLQLLIENAIKHNAISRENPLVIKIVSTSESLFISNNIIARKSAAAGTGMGLVNIKNRFGLLEPKEIVIQNDGYTFTVCLPLIKSS
ncbi:MAG: two-component regulator propeller domain-containing protein [Ferruginibacter sp.]